MKSIVRAICAAAGFAACTPAMAIFTNGGFESGTFGSWTTGSGINTGLTGAQPFTSASIGLGSGGSFRGSVVTTGAVELSGAPITLPYSGTYTARVNNADTGGIANYITQADVITNADRDAADGKLHVRFAYAVVLSNPGHSPSGQPYFFIRVRNVTKNTTLFEDFSFAGQTGTQFVPIPSNTSTLYLNWKPADVVVPDADLGDSIEVYLLASDCQPTGHTGYAYLDGFGSAVVTQGATATVVPTLSESALLGLGALLFGSALFATRRSRAGKA
ncbi:MAG: hypothetical protein JNL19_06055 [Burkholderiales bacterium]|nr:hypothetical protein [Burkholderiales bacterium]